MVDKGQFKTESHREHSTVCRSYKSLGINVHKFGGSSLATTEQLVKVCDIIVNHTKPGDIVVVSANGDVTDRLIDAAHGRHRSILELVDYFRQLSSGLAIDADKFLKQLGNDIEDIQVLCQQQPVPTDSILAFGEIWSARLLVNLLSSHQCTAQAVDASHYLKLTSLHEYSQFDEQFAEANFSSLYESTLNHLEPNYARFVFTGFIASDNCGKLVTLGRNGSDYSATVIAQLVKAASVTIWTDVDGIFTADPNIVSNAQGVEHLSLCEAQAISELGANVLHQKTVTPLLTYKTSATIKSSLLDVSHGTQITQHPTSSGQVKTIAAKQALVRIVINNINELSARTVQQKILLNQIASYASNFDRTLDRLTFYVAEPDRFNCISIIQAAQFYPIVEKIICR